MSSLFSVRAVLEDVIHWEWASQSCSLVSLVRWEQCGVLLPAGRFLLLLLFSELGATVCGAGVDIARLRIKESRYSGELSKKRLGRALPASSRVREKRFTPGKAQLRLPFFFFLCIYSMATNNRSLNESRAENERHCRHAQALSTEVEADTRQE